MKENTEERGELEEKEGVKGNAFGYPVH